MAPDDRERIFEKALSRHLRSNASGDPHSSPLACPDAEIVAAYHDRLLAADQMLSAKEHIVSCSRCQQILAQLEATDEVAVELPIEEDQEQASRDNRDTQKVLAMSAPAPSEHSSVTEQQTVPATHPSRAAARWARRFRAHPGANWRWLAPAGVLAAALLVWIGIHESNPQPFQLAKNQQQSPSLQTHEPLSSTAAPNAKEPAQKQLSDQRTAIPSPSRQDLDGAIAKRDETAKLDPKAAPAVEADKLTATRPQVSSKDLNAEKYDDTNAPKVADGSRAQDGAGEQELKKQSAASAGAPAPPSTPAPLPTEQAEDNSNAALSNGVPAAKPSAPSAKARAIAPAGQQQPQQLRSAVTALAGGQTDVVALHANARSFVTITAPDSTVLWRAARDGIIQHSTDSGSTWSVQPSGVVTDLLGGSAPSEQVCWIVGRSGTIVRTTDGGESWRKLPSPVAGDLVSIFAVDAQQATVTAAYTAKSYKTVDGGQTWTPLSTP